MTLRLILFLMLSTCAGTLAVHSAQNRLSLLGKDASALSGGALINLSQPTQGLLTASLGDTASGLNGGSLFSGRSEGGLFAPPPPRQETAPPARIAHSGIKGLRQLIASAEAGSAGYNAVQHGAKVKPAKLPTKMTIAEVYQWIAAILGQPHAIGRYQFIPATLKRLVKKTGVPKHAMFDPRVQDILADQLMAEAGLNAFLTGKMKRTTFMNNLAKIWAGLPTSQGKSHYHGYAGNYATITWARFKSEMDRIFPKT